MSERNERLQLLATLEKELKRVQQAHDETYEHLRTHERIFSDMENRITRLKRVKRRMIKFIRSIGAYVLGRRNLKHLYSKSFKIKHAMNRLKPYKYYLYDLGFIEATLPKLRKKLQTTEDKYLRRALLWELGLWYANEQSKYGSRHSLQYLYEFLKDETDKDLIRRATILLVENLQRLGYEENAKTILQALLKDGEHPDIYLAMANLYNNIEERLQWMNKAFTYYGLAEITFGNETGDPTYEDLQTEPIEQTIQYGPKVSVLLPAYNAETGIQVAIESILQQTWKNLELIIIDDCSTDNTLSVIKQYAKQDERISYYQTPENGGPYVARNIGLQHAIGKYVTVNDADDWSHAEKLERQIKHLEENDHIIANTSEHARLTEELMLHRRGTPGTYIFSNMSSLMFRREIVMEKLGYWDSVRFAADGEFKRRLVKVFGPERIVDLKTGPLSLPRQSVSSLTASSAFGYSGFFMGVRKEYVASFTSYHQQADDLYYPFPMKERLFPVPEPMWIRREEKQNGKRHFDVVNVADFSINKSLQNDTIQEINVHKNLGIRTGITLESCYNMIRPKEINENVRKLIDGHNVQTLVYGEHITCDVLIIRGHSILEENQLYLPDIMPHMVVVILDDDFTNIRQISREVQNRYGKIGLWYAFDEKTLTEMKERNIHDLRYIDLAKEAWSTSHKRYEQRLRDWITHLH